MIVNRPLLVHTWDGVGGVFTGIMSFHVEKKVPWQLLWMDIASRGNSLSLWFYEGVLGCD